MGLFHYILIMSYLDQQFYIDNTKEYFRMVAKHISKIIIFTFILALVIAVSGVAAQDDISCGDIVEEELDDETMSFMVQVEDESVLIITLEADDFDPYLEIYDEDGDIYTEDDDGAGNLNSRVTISEEGEFEVVVTSFSGSGEGDFMLSVSCAAGCEVIEEELEDDSTMEFELEAEADDSYLISLSSDDFDTYLYLLDEDEDIVAENDDGGAGLNSQLLYTFEDGGEYIIQVTSFSSDEEGAFTLVVCTDTDDIGELDTESGEIPDVGMIECGDAIEGIIDDDTPIALFLFEGEEGDEVTITLTATSDEGLDPYLGLFTIDGIEDGDTLAENDDADGLNSEIVYELEDDDSYVIVATRFGFEEGSSEGDFELELECN